MQSYQLKQSAFSPNNSDHDGSLQMMNIFGIRFYCAKFIIFKSVFQFKSRLSTSSNTILSKNNHKDLQNLSTLINSEGSSVSFNFSQHYILAFIYISQMRRDTINTNQQIYTRSPIKQIRVFSPPSASLFNSTNHRNIRPNTTNIPNDKKYAAISYQKAQPKNKNSTNRPGYSPHSRVLQTLLKHNSQQSKSKTKIQNIQPKLLHTQNDLNLFNKPLVKNVKIIESTNLSELQNSCKNQQKIILESIVVRPTNEYNINQQLNVDADLAQYKRNVGLSLHKNQNNQFSMYDQYFIQFITQGKKMKQMIQKLMSDNKILIEENRKYKSEIHSKYQQIQRLNNLVLQSKQQSKQKIIKQKGLQSQDDSELEQCNQIISTLQVEVTHLKNVMYTPNLPVVQKIDAKNYDKQIMDLRKQNSFMMQKMQQLLKEIQIVQQKFQNQQQMLIQENQIFRGAANEQIQRLKKIIKVLESQKDSTVQNAGQKNLSIYQMQGSGIENINKLEQSNIENKFEQI